MKPIDKDELYEHLSGFLKNRGVEIKPGTYTKGIQTGCSVLADAINLSQAGIELARAEVEKKLDQMRQVIHESTAPRPPTAPAPAKKAKVRTAQKQPAAQAGGNRGSKPRPKPKKAGTKAGKK